MKPAKARILVVEDDKKIASFIYKGLKEVGFAVDVAGDGSIQMNIQEMATAIQCNLPVKVVILNNGYLGMVRQWQKLFYDGRMSASDRLLSYFFDF